MHASRMMDRGTALLRRSLRAALAASILAILAACSGSDDGTDGTEEGEAAISAGGPLDPEKDDAVTRASWQTIGAGVSYKALAGGSNVLLVYGGYSAQDVFVQRWTNELFRKKGAALAIGHLYAVRGPNQPLYVNHEIENSKLARHLRTGPVAEARSVVVLAHSSGSYVANELFSALREGTGAGSPQTLEKVTFFDLDGGSVAEAALKKMAGAYFVSACDATIGRCSHNAGGMKSLGATYAALGGAITVNADQSQCSREAGGLWCLHDALINTRPHNPLAYDLRRDYTDFTGGRAVVTSYLDEVRE